MNYKIQGAIKKNKKSFIILVILWIFIAIVFVAPLTYAFYCTKNGENFISSFSSSISNPFNSIGEIFSKGLLESYFKNLGIISILYLVVFFIGFFRSAPKNRYTDIEHGSSDWSQHGEQYEVLSNKEGIILSEGNYLPVDKRGNVNVLIVGRIRSW